MISGADYEMWYCSTLLKVAPSIISTKPIFITPDPILRPPLKPNNRERLVPMGSWRDSLPINASNARA